MVVILRLLEPVVAGEIVQMMVALPIAVDIHNPQHLGAFHFENAKGTCRGKVAEEQSIGPGTLDVSKHPDPSFLHHVAAHVLIGIDRQRLKLHAPFLCRYMVQILVRERSSGNRWIFVFWGSPPHRGRAQSSTRST